MTDDPQQLTEEIEQTREQLGETVDQLVAKTDVKARARDRTSQVTASFRRRPVPLVAATAAAVVAWIVILRWRRR